MDADSPWHDIAAAGTDRLLIIADHASNRVPPDIDLRAPPELLQQHIAVDIGVAPLAEMLCKSMRCGAILGNISRLVIDLNREAENPGLVPSFSDGHSIPGNSHLDTGEMLARLDRYWRPYHEHVAGRIASTAPHFLLSLHSFTPWLASNPAPRPWEIGILYNQDARLAKIAIPMLRHLGLTVGDNEPYSGQLLNATMNRHAEARAIPYLGVEIRQDLIDTPHGQRRWCEILIPILKHLATTLDA